MKRIITLCALALSTFSINSATAQTDAKAKTILSAVTQKINTVKTMKAGFSFKMLNAAGKQMQSKSGTFYMKGPKYRVSLGSQEIFCDNKTVWTYTKDANEVQVSAYNPAEQTISPSKLFTNFYEKEYTSRYIGQRKVAGKNCDIIELTPIAKGKQFTKVELAVDPAKMISGGTVYEKNGSKIQYEVSNMTPNAAVSDATFAFDAKKYPGVEIVDLR